MPDTRRASSHELSLLGGWELVADGEWVPLGGREQRLCALLALTGTRSRAQVAGTLWPESTDARALASLRRALAQTRDRCPGLVVADRTQVGLAPDVVVDVDRLRAAAVPPPEPGGGLLAVLVGAPLLPGWYDEWVEGQREDLERMRVDALEHLARRALETEDDALAESAARAVARIEPWRESASELMVRALLSRGDRAGAVHELERYREVLRVELGVVPSPALVALVEAAEPARPPAAGKGVLAARPTTAPVAPPVTPPVAVPVAVPVLASSAAPTPPTGPSGRSAAARLAAGAALVLAASLAIARLGPPPEQRDAPSVAEPSPQPRAGKDIGGTPRQVLVRTVTAAEGSAAFLVRATRLPARVKVAVADGSGSRVVRSVVVRSGDGRRLVVSGLAGGTYAWSATSPAATRVTGEVRVADEVPAVVLAAQEPRVVPSPTEGPEPQSETRPEPSITPTATPTATPAAIPTATPTQQPTRPRPSDPPDEPTDPGTQDPGPVG